MGRISNAIKDTFKNRTVGWPNETARRLLEANFRDAFGMIGVIGCIDGSHLPLYEAPLNDPVSYYNRKGDYSIQLQGIIDDRSKSSVIQELFFSYLIGWPGSVHDAKVFKNSDAYKNRNSYFSRGQYLLGDQGYPLLESLMVPYKVPTTRSQLNFNIKLSRTRVLVENAFALLKGRFQQLKQLRFRNMELCLLSIEATLILHNIAILLGFEEPEFYGLETNDDGEEESSDE